MCLIAGAPASFANVLNNGGFETPVVPAGSYQTITPGAEPAGFGWSVTAGNVDIVMQTALGASETAFDGVQCLDLDGNVPGAIAQTFATRAGTTYTLKFAYANNFSGGGTNAQAVVTVVDATTGSNLIAPIPIAHNNSSAAGLNWTQSGTIQFTAQGSTTTLTFASTDPSGSTGVLLDGVSVDPVLASGTTQVLPQFAFGGGWYSALYFTNTGTTPVSFPVTFVADNGSPLNVPSVGGSSTTVNLGPRATTVIEAPNVGALTQGYVSVALPAGVTGYGVFRQSVAGQPDQEAVVPLSNATSSSSTLSWDDTNFTTAVAIANPTAAPVTVAITLWDAAGNIIGTAVASLAPQNKIETVLHNLPGLAGMIGTRGSATFLVPSGSVAVLGLRFDGAAFTSIPAMQQ
jgi:choice-of-anchor C domain-containing protein